VWFFAGVVLACVLFYCAMTLNTQATHAQRPSALAVSQTAPVRLPTRATNMNAKRGRIAFTSKRPQRTKQRRPHPTTSAPTDTASTPTDARGPTYPSSSASTLPRSSPTHTAEILSKLEFGVTSLPHLPAPEDVRKARILVW